MKQNQIHWNIPQIVGEPLHISIAAGDQIFIVGPNGSGKSALIQHFVSLHGSQNQPQRIQRIAAHRQTWLTSGSIDVTPNQRRQFDEVFKADETDPASRWMDRTPHERQSAVLFDLVAQENDRARRITRQVDDGKECEAKRIADKIKSPFTRLNDLLQCGMLTITLEDSLGEEILARHRGANTLFSMAQMSDGERNATIIAANVLTVEPGTILLIDEPERHLHRSIIEPFLSAVFEQRQDCTFIISTHELALPIANPRAQVLMVRSCRWGEDTAEAWDAEFFQANPELSESLNRAILGARRRILFVEGTSGSLDLQLYSALFPDLSVVPQGNCVDVRKAVMGLRDTSNLHHLEAFGLVDRDNCREEEIERLAGTRVFALEVYSVEALYYCQEAIEAVAARQAESLGRDAEQMIASAKQKALRVLTKGDLVERMAARRAAGRIHDSVLSQIPEWQSVKEHTDPRISVSVDSPYPEELDRFRKLVADERLDELVARYPLRESCLFSTIAGALDCRNRRNYEQMLLSRLRADENLARKLKQRVGPLATALGSLPSGEAG